VHHPSKGITNGVEIDDRVEIACHCDNNVSTTAWYFNGSRITDVLPRDSNPYVSSVNLGYLTLVIPNFLPPNAGDYTCASSSDDDKSTVIKLSISQQCK